MWSIIISLKFSFRDASLCFWWGWENRSVMMAAYTRITSNKERRAHIRRVKTSRTASNTNERINKLRPSHEAGIVRSSSAANYWQFFLLFEKCRQRLLGWDYQISILISWNEFALTKSPKHKNKMWTLSLRKMPKSRRARYFRAQFTICLFY